MHTFNNNESRKQSRLAKVKALVCNENYMWAHGDLDKNYVIRGNDYCLTVKPDGTIKSFVQGKMCWNEFENINDVWVDKIDKLIDQLWYANLSVDDTNIELLSEKNPITKR